MTDPTSGYAVYMLRGLPAGVFGEAYVVVAGAQLPAGVYRAEHFILTQRPSEAVHRGKTDILAPTFPAEMGTVDASLCREEALHQAELDLQEMLEARSIDLGRPDLAYLRFELKACPSPFVGCKMRGRFVPQLEAIGDATQCRPLANYLSLLKQVRVVRHAG